MGDTPDNILSQCTLQPARRRNTALRLTPAMIYYDQNKTRATQTCGTRHTFSLKGQGIFLIPPTCSLSFNNAIFRNTDKKKINHHQQQQQIIPLTFSDQTIMDNEIDFPEQRQSFVTTQESMISHAFLLLLIAILSLFTKLIHSYAASFKSKNNPSPDPENPETPQPSAPQYHENPYPVNYRVADNNISLYPRQSRIFSPAEENPQWETRT